MTVWKFETLVADEVTIQMPRGARILHVAPTLTPAFLQLWAVVDPKAGKVGRRLSIRGTGHELGEVGSYVATVQAGSLVWHIFEAAAPPPSERPVTV